MKYVYVLEYSYGAIYEFTVAEEDIERIEEILREKFLRPKDCEWIIVDNPLKIEKI